MHIVTFASSKLLVYRYTLHIIIELLHSLKISNS